MRPRHAPPALGALPDLAKLATAGLRSADADPQTPHRVIHSVTVRLKGSGDLTRDDVELIAAYARAAAEAAARLPGTG